MKRQKRKLLPLLLALIFLLAACAGTPVPAPPSPAPAAESPVSTAVAVPTAAPVQDTEAPAAPAPSPVAAPSPTPEPTPTAAPSPEPAPEERAPRCTLSISCGVLLEHLDELAEGKGELVPESGWLLAPTEVALEEGDSVFDLLRRACREAGIHMEFSVTPGLDTAYIEGIGNLYEFDCGGLSGWVFAVNGLSPNRGCSDIFPQDGDRIEWCYTCDLGDDLPHIARG